MTATKRILIICRKPPYGSSLPREALDTALAASVFDQQLSVLFSGEGVWQLLKDQQAEQVSQKGYDTMLSAFPLYDITDLYVAEQSLQERQLSPHDLVVPVSPLSAEGVRELMARHDVILNF